MTDSVPPGGAPGEKPPGAGTSGAGYAGASSGAPGPDQMRASDADRERVAEHLRDAMAEGRLDMDEFQERLEATYQARTYGELAPITRDLPSAAGGAGSGVAPVSMSKAPDAAGGPNWPARIGQSPTSAGAFAFWGGFARKGRWVIGKLFTAFAMWGGGEIDLREASFEDRDTTIRCFTIMGGMQVTVPPGLNVHVSGIGIMGGFGGVHGFSGEGDPDAPHVKVTGFALMGGVGVERKLTRAEKQLRKEEERRLKEERRRDRLEGRLEAHEERRYGLEGRFGGRHELQARREAQREWQEAQREWYEAQREAHREWREEHRERREAHRAHRREVREARMDRRSGRRGRFASDDHDT